MEKLTQLENSVSKLSNDEFEEFRQWFWQYENERWDVQLEKDIKENKLDLLANEAIENFKKGNYKPL
jgi:hypothetical protein